MVDTAFYWALMALLVGIIAWLLFVPAPGHEAVIVLHHSGLLA
jgi:hypothetical protein